VRTVLGSAAHPSVLVDAGIEDCDLMIAVTQSDETNLVACKLAQQLFNVPTRIVRLRATDYLSNEKVLGPDLLRRRSGDLPGAGADGLHRQADRISRGAAGARIRARKVSLVAVRAFQGGPLVGHPLRA